MSHILLRDVRTDDLPVLAAMYIACFREPPWYEVFTLDEVIEEFRTICSWTESAFLVAEDGDGRIIGAGIGFSIERKPDVRERLPVDLRESFYVAELFVDPLSRTRGTCQAMILRLTQMATERGFLALSVRTSSDQPIIRHLFVDRLGCTIVGTEEVISEKMIDGVHVALPDKRILMGKIL